jgi:hypothetical protein
MAMSFPLPHGRGGNQTFTAFNLRKNWVEAIVWRAAGIHQEPWSPGLQAAALEELLEHRLRIVERMKYNVTAPATIGGEGTMTFASPRSRRGGSIVTVPACSSIRASR